MSEPGSSAVDNAATEHRPASDPRSPSAPRFTPGTMLGERYRIVALVGAILVFGVAQPRNGSLFEIAAGVVMSVILTFILVRLGMLALSIVVFTHNFMQEVPFTIHQSAWFFGQSAVVLAVLIAASAWGFWVCLGEKKPFGVAALDEA